MEKNKGIIQKRIDGEGAMAVHEETFIAWLQQFPKDRYGWRHFNFTELKSQKHEGTFFNIVPKKTKTP